MDSGHQKQEDELGPLEVEVTNLGRQRQEGGLGPLEGEEEERSSLGRRKTVSLTSLQPFLFGFSKGLPVSVVGLPVVAGEVDC